MILAPTASLVDVAFAACTVLERARETAVLCGGSAAAYYSSGHYESLDLDFVVQIGAAPHVVDRALATIGYTHSAEGYFRHPALKYVVEFQVGPLAVGREAVTAWRTNRRGEELLHVLTPTDVVRDRFLHYWAWGDQTALDIALEIVRARDDIDLDAFRAWTERESETDGSYDRARVERFLRLVHPSG